MLDNLDACLAVVLASEGGYVVDDGGPTNLGVTQKILSDYMGRQATIADVKALTRQSVRPIYAEMFWLPAKCDTLPVGPNLMHFDAAVNQGQGAAVTILQGALGEKPDGAFGPQTALALRGYLSQYGAERLITALHAGRERAYRADRGFALYGKVWLERNDRTAAVAMQMAHA